MPNSRSVTDFAARIQQIGIAAQKSQIQGVERASLLVKREIEKELTRAVGGDHKMSNLRKKGGAPARTLSVGYKIRKRANPTSLVHARGPWHLVEYGSKKHGIFPTGAIAGKRKKGRDVDQAAFNRLFGARIRGLYSGMSPMPINGNFRYAVRNHPGTTGKLPFHNGLLRAQPRAIKELHATVHSAVADVIRSGRETYVYIRGDVGAYT